MSNDKQSSVENFWKQLEEKGFQETEGVNRINISIDVNDYMELKKQAKAMHKEEIIKSWMATDNELQRISAEQYYNERFGGNNEQKVISEKASTNTAKGYWVKDLKIQGGNNE